MSEVRDANLTSGRRPVPALNTTSDAPDVDPLPEPAPVSEPVQEPTPPPVPTPAEPTPPPAPTLPSGRGEIQERFSELTSRRREAVARAEEAEAKVKQLSEALEKALPIIERFEKESKPPPTPVDSRPDRNAFDTPESYEDALISWSSDRAAIKAVEKAQEAFEKRLADQREADAKTAREQDTAREQAQVASDFMSRCTEFKKEVPDFDYDELASRPPTQFPVSEYTAQAIWTDDNGPAILHHLGQNPEEARRIFQLPPIRQISEIGRLSATVSKSQAAPAPPPPAPAPPNNLPPPIASEVLGSGSSGAPTGGEPSMDEWAARRTPVIMADRRASSQGLPRPN